MISNKRKRLILIAMLQELEDKITRAELIDWFITRTERGNSDISSNEITVKELLSLAENVGIEVKI